MGDLGKSIVAKGLNSCPKSNKLPNLVTLFSSNAPIRSQIMTEKQDCGRGSFCGAGGCASKAAGPLSATVLISKTLKRNIWASHNDEGISSIETEAVIINTTLSLALYQRDQMVRL